jgi:hypothetical protein
MNRRNQSHCQELIERIDARHRQTSTGCDQASGKRRLKMFRKFVLASAALAALGVASLASTAPASAGWHGHNHNHFGPRFIARPVIIASDYGCWRKRFIETPYGVIVKHVNVCY